MSWFLTSLRRLRDARVAAAGLSIFVFVTVFLFMAAPRALAAAADSVLHQQLSAASESVRGVSLVRESRIPLGANAAADPLRTVIEAGQQMEQSFPPSVEGLVQGRSIVVDTSRWTVWQPRLMERTLRIRFQPGAADHIRLLEGRLPAITGAGSPVEIALSRASVRVLGLTVGQTIQLESDGSDRLSLRGSAELAAVVVGAFEVIDGRDPFWVDDESLSQPTIRQVSPGTQVDDATALASDGSYLSVSGRVPTAVDFRYTWRYRIDPTRLVSGSVDPLLDALGRMQVIFPSAIATGGTAPVASLTGNLRGLLETYATAWRSIQTVFLVIGIGVAAVAFAALGLVTALASAGRRTVVSLWRSRGASEGQILRSTLAEALVIVLPSTLVALGAALLLIGSAPPAQSIAIAVGVAVAETVLMAVALPRSPAGPPREQSRADPSLLRTPPRRLILEGLVVVVALVGAYLLRERGVRGASSTGELTSADPFIAAVPALAGLAAGLVVMRLFGLPLRLFARISSLRRDLVPVLALRRLSRSSAGGAVLVVLLATGAVWAFASSALVHLERAADVVAWQEVGADYRISSGTAPLPQTFDAKSISGVEASAGAYVGPASLRIQGVAVALVGLDVGDYLKVVGGTPGDPHLPAAMLGAPGAVLPAIVSTALAEGVRGIDAGEAFEIIAAGQRLPLTAVEARDAFPGLDTNDPFVIISRDQLFQLRHDLAEATMTEFLRAPVSADAAITLGASGHASGASVDRRVTRSASIQGSPVVGIVRQGALAAVAAAGVFAVLAVAAALALSGAARANEVAHLRALGLGRRQAFGLLVIEHVPTVLIAFAGGLSLGLGLFIGLRPSLGLTAVIGSSIDVPVQISAAQAFLILIAVAAIAALGVGLAAAIQRRVVPSLALRGGAE